MADLIREGKVARWGISEADEAYLRRAHAVCPVTAVQNRYSMMARGVESLFPVLEELGVGLVAFSPMANGFLTGRYGKGEAFDPKTDYRAAMPQFADEAVDQNRALLDLLRRLAAEKGATPAADQPGLDALQKALDRAHPRHAQGRTACGRTPGPRACASPPKRCRPWTPRWGACRCPRCLAWRAGRGAEKMRHLRGAVITGRNAMGRSGRLPRAGGALRHGRADPAADLVALHEHAHLCATAAPRCPICWARPLGHEMCGEITKVGPEVKDFRVGDRVIVCSGMPVWRSLEAQDGMAKQHQDNLYTGVGRLLCGGILHPRRGHGTWRASPRASAWSRR